MTNKPAPIEAYVSIPGLSPIHGVAHQESRDVFQYILPFPGPSSMVKCRPPRSASMTEESIGDKVLLQTNMGDITLELFPSMPITVGNFRKLAEKGFYDGTIFHRVIDGFMIQGGDPTGTGRGGPGYTIKDELPPNNRNDRGTISMANAGPNTGGSQFFINLVDNNYLDRAHPAFGKVVEGMDVVDRIGKAPKGPSDRPLKEIMIIKAKLAE